MARDDRRQKLIANLLSGMSKPEAARTAGYSESFARVNVYALVKSVEFQEELAQASAASGSASPKTRQPASADPSNVSPLGSPQTAEIEQLSPNDGLTLKEQLFRDYYLGEARGNGTLAAKLAGYDGDDNTLGVTAYHLLRKSKIQNSIQQALNTVKMSADEVLERLSKQARGSLADVLDDNGRFDLQTIKDRGTDGLLRKLKIRKRIERGSDGSETEYVNHDLEIHNSQAALELLGKHHRLFGDVTGEPHTTETFELYELAVILHNALTQGAIDVTPEHYIDVTPEPATSHL
jgi:phage terminase small subunit